MQNYLGIDIGTTGVRAVLVNNAGTVQARAETVLPDSNMQDGMLIQNPAEWWHGVLECLHQLNAGHGLAEVAGIAIDGTSGTTLLTDTDNTPISPALMYNDIRPAGTIGIPQEITGGTPANSRSSALSKAIWLNSRFAPHSCLVQQQADWVMACFTARPGISDWNNSLKLGFDVEMIGWPDWIHRLLPSSIQLPRVFAPGHPVGRIAPEISRLTGLPDSACLHAGTTDSIAAFLASGARQPGEAVTSLGTTLVLKLCSSKPVISNKHGVYSHRLDHKRWLTGGASNSGGGALKSAFSLDEIRTLSAKIDPEQDSGLDYYPLPANGERFPVADPAMRPRMEPVAQDKVLYLHGLLEGIARIEKKGYDLLEQLGADKITSVRSSGGGSESPAFTRIRERIVERPFIASAHVDAAYGSALLAMGKI